MDIKFDMNKVIGWIGTGVMGEAMCHRLLDAGYSLHVTTRSREKANELVVKGAVFERTAAEVVSKSDVVFTMVGSPDEVEQVYFSDHGIFSIPVTNKILVDMGTTPPSLCKKIKTRADQLQAEAIDAPVSGGDIGAVDGTLSIMAAGNENTINSLAEVFACLGSVMYMGASGNGQHTKMCNQITVASTMIGVCEALLYAKKAGLDCSSMVAAIRPGAAGCWSLDNLAPRIIREDFTPGFMVDHFVKDLGIALTEAELMEMELPGLQLAYRLYQTLQVSGEGRRGTQALMHALDELA